MLVARSEPRSGFGVAVPNRALYSSKIIGKRARSDTLACHSPLRACRQTIAACQLNACDPPLGYSNRPRVALNSWALVMSYWS